MWRFSEDGKVMPMLTRYFNTSNVTVQLGTVGIENPTIRLFQYIKCDGSALWSDWYKTCIWISIHQMWRFSAMLATIFGFIDIFQYIKCDGSAIIFGCESWWGIVFQYIKCDGSAVLNYKNGNRAIVFQYIKCDGSAECVAGNLEITLEFQYIKCDGSACKWCLGGKAKMLFQYIKCDGSAPVRALRFTQTQISIHQMWRFSDIQVKANIVSDTDFNTSNVTVQQKSRR